jgi:hypothetical protein
MQPVQITSRPESRTPACARHNLAAMVAEAADQDTSPERLDVLSRFGTTVRIAVAANPGTPPGTLERLARSSTPAIRTAVAGNPNASLATLLACAARDPQAFLNNPALPFLELDSPDLLKSMRPAAFAAIARHPSTPRGLIEAMVEGALSDGDRRRIGVLLTRADLTGPQAQRLLSRAYGERSVGLFAHAAVLGGTCLRDDPDSLARTVLRPTVTEAAIKQIIAWCCGSMLSAGTAILARTRALPQDVLLTMLERAQPHVRLAIARNPRTPLTVLAQLQSDTHPDVIMALQANPSTPAAIRQRLSRVARTFRQLLAGQPTEIPLEKLAGSRRLDIRAAVAAHPDASPGLCQRFASARSLVLRRLAAGHHNTPDHCLLDLIEESRWDPIDFGAIRLDEPVRPLVRFLHGPDSTTMMALHQLIQRKRAEAGGQALSQTGGTQVAVPQLRLETILDGLPIRVIAVAPESALANYAHFDQAHPEVLELIGRHAMEALAGTQAIEAVAANPRTPPSVLERLCQHGNRFVHVAAACNPGLPVAAARTLLAERPDRGHQANHLGLSLHQAAAAHPDLSLEERRGTWQDKAEVIHTLTRNPKGAVMVRSGLWNPKVDPSHGMLIGLDASALELLAMTPGLSADLPREIARHASTSPATLRRLALSGCGRVLEAVAQHPDTPADVLHRLMTEPGIPTPVARTAASHPSVSPDHGSHVERLLVGRWVPGIASCPSWRLTLTHPACPEKRLGRYAESADFGDRFLVAVNPSTPRQTLRTLAHDGMVIVRDAARRTLREIEALSSTLVVPPSNSAA